MNSRNGYRERALAACVGTLTLRIPKLRPCSLFPEDVIDRHPRVDGALVDLCSRPLDGSPVPYVWLDATYVKCRREGRDAATVTAMYHAACDMLAGCCPWAAAVLEQAELWQESRFFSEVRMNELDDDGRTRGSDGPVDWARLEAEARKMLESGLELADRVEAA